NRHSSTFSACSVNKAKLTPSPSQLEPSGYGWPSQTRENFAFDGGIVHERVSEVGERRSGWGKDFQERREAIHGGFGRNIHVSHDPGNPSPNRCATRPPAVHEQCGRCCSASPVPDARA